MPQAFLFRTAELAVLVWKIEEDLSFFSKTIHLNKLEAEEYFSIRHPQKKIEWMAARFVQRQLINDSIVKDEYGKPHLSQHPNSFISLSHCKDYAAASFHAKESTGIDVEPIHEKVLRISDKFLKPSEKEILVDDTIISHIAAWSIKEVVYKKYGKKELRFKENIHLAKLSLNEEKAEVVFTKNQIKENLEISVKRIDDIILAFV